MLLDGASFGGFFNTLDAVPHLYLSGVAPYVVKKGDDIPIALSQVFAVSADLVGKDIEDTEIRV